MRWNEWLSELFRRFHALFARGERFHRDLEEEMSLHRDLRARELRDDGASLEDARYAAQRRFGNTLQLREEIHQAWGWTWLDRLILDLRYGIRRLRRSPGFTTVAVLTLALGIGANTAIYSFMDALLLRSLPVSDPQSLVVLNWHSRPDKRHGGGKFRTHVLHSMDGSTYDDPSGVTSGVFPFPAFELFHEKSDSVFASVFAYHPAYKRNLIVKGQAEIAAGEYVSGDYFRGLAVRPAAGRLIVGDDDRVGATPVVVISMGLSQRRFGGAWNAVGQSILIDNLPFTVAGVTPPEFFGVDPATAPDFYLPMHTDLVLDSAGPWGVTPQKYHDQNYYWIEVMARLRPGVSLAQAQAALAQPFRQWVESTATNDQERANLPALVVREGAGGLDNLRRQYSKPLFVLLTMVGLILAIACANIANLQLARATGRRREMAVRLSLGAGRLRVMRLLLMESLLVASLGGMSGGIFAAWGVRFLTLLLANGQENFTLRAELNWHVLGATLALSLLCGTLFGLAPAIQSARPDAMSALKDLRASEPGGRTWFGFLRINLKHALVVSQIAISLLMLVAAGLFVRTLSNLQSIQLGFNRKNVLLFDMNARQAGHSYPEIVAFYADLGRRFNAIPGVRATLSHSSLIGAGRSLPISVSGTPADARILDTGPAFFTTMQIPMLLGREIDERDQPDSPPVAVINELFAKTYFGQENPVGRRITLGGRNPRDMEIVGVAENAHYGELRKDVPPVVFLPYNQGNFPPVEQMTYALRTSGDPLSYIKTVREIVHRADSRVPLTNVTTQTAEIDQGLNQEIIFARLCTGFGILALIIACVGLYGTMSYNVARRTGEIGIRMALGAQRGEMVWMILREVVVVAALGLAISLPIALATSKLIQSFLFGMKPNDPLTLILAVTTLLGSALAAGYVPARRASRIDPMVALRHE